MSYTNIIKTRVIDSLETLLRTEFVGIRIYYDKIEGKEGILIRPVTDDYLSHSAASHNRTYQIDLRVYQKLPGDVTKSKTIEPLTNQVERIKRLLFNNANYSPSSVYKYHDGIVLRVDYSPPLEDWELELNEFKIVSIIYQTTVSEAIS